MIELIHRPTYTERIIPFIDKNIIKVLTGQRRVGKSCILRQLQTHIQSTVSNPNIIYINKELDDFITIRTHEDLSAYITEKLTDDRPNYLFIDEVQDIQGFEHTLRNLQAKNACDIFITGSRDCKLNCVSKEKYY